MYLGIAETDDWMWIDRSKCTECGRKFEKPDNDMDTSFVGQMMCVCHKCAVEMKEERDREREKQNGRDAI